VSSGSAEAFEAGERIAKLSVLTLVSLGLLELIVGFVTGSLGVKADGIDSISDSIISVIVWLGLHFSRRRPDARFHFGYHKVESLSALIVSFGMIGTATYILYHSYLTFLNPKPLQYPQVALAVLMFAGTVALYRAFQMRSIARKYRLLSLRTDANNSIKDGTASFVVFASVLGASLGIHEFDAVAGMVISIYIYIVAYVAIRESSLILLDACESPEIASVLESALTTIEGISKVRSIRLRPSGPYLTGLVSVAVNGSKTISETENLRKKILDVVSTIIEPVGDVTVVFRSDGAS
jgi:cation diffusion facilitator family transporter